MTTAAAQPGNIPGSSLGFNLGAIALAVALLGIGLAYAVDRAGRGTYRPASHFDDQVTLTRTLGGKELEVPQSWFRYAEQAADGFAKQIDLQLPLPLGPANAPLQIDVTLLPRSQVRPSSSLLDGVYLHQFDRGQLPGPAGLVGKRLTGTEGYEGESVWYDAISANPFVAKCSPPIANGLTARCVRTAYLGPGIAAVYVFDEVALDHWRQFDAELARWLARLGAL